MADISDLSELINVVNSVRGVQSRTRQSGGTTKQTTKTDVSDAGVNQLIKEILSGPGGVRSIGNAARSAGVYDSTTEEQALGELYASAANKAELARAPTTVTTENPEVIQETGAPGIGIGGLVGTLAGSSALSSIMKNEVPFSGALGGDTSKIFGEGGIIGGEGGGFSGVKDAVSSIFNGGGGTAASATPAITDSAISAANSVAGGTAGAGAGSAGGFMSQVSTGGTSAAATGGGLASKAGGFIGANAMPLGGSFLSGLVSGEDATKDPMSLALNAGMGALAMGPVGLIAAPAAAVLGGMIGGGKVESVGKEISRAGRKVEKGVKKVGRSVGKAVGTVICTALMYKGHLDKEEYRTALQLMHELHPTALRGYHYWAVEVANKIRQGHKGWTTFWKPIMRSRMKLLASGGGFVNHCRYPLGTGTKYILEPGCYVIGKFLEFRDGKDEAYNYGRN